MAKQAGLRRWRRRALRTLGGVFWLLLFTACLKVQAQAQEKPIPILSGSAGYFNFITAGKNLIDTQVNPVLLLPVGERWMLESRGEFEGQFQRPSSGGPYGGPVEKHLDY